MPQSRNDPLEWVTIRCVFEYKAPTGRQEMIHRLADDKHIRLWQCAACCSRGSSLNRDSVLQRLDACLECPKTRSWLRNPGSDCCNQLKDHEKIMQWEERIASNIRTRSFCVVPPPFSLGFSFRGDCACSARFILYIPPCILPIFRVI